MSNNGPYVDIDDQEYRPGPLAPVCPTCRYLLALCDCPPVMHREPRGEADAIIGWWPTALFAMAALALGVLFERGVL